MRNRGLSSHYFFKLEIHAKLEYAPYSIAICDSQPLIVEGIQSLFLQEAFTILAVTTTFDELQQRLRQVKPDIALIDKELCSNAFYTWLKNDGQAVSTVVWGLEVSEAETLQLLQSGVRGILQKSATPEAFLSCLKAVAQGGSWIEESVLSGGVADERYPRSELTPREREIAALIERGLSNDSIARELGISRGTVKIHLKHIYEKTGVRGRYGLALTAMRHRGLFSVSNSKRTILIP